MEFEVRGQTHSLVAISFFVGVSMATGAALLMLLLSPQIYWPLVGVFGILGFSGVFSAYGLSAVWTEIVKHREERAQSRLSREVYERLGSGERGDEESPIPDLSGTPEPEAQPGREIRGVKGGQPAPLKMPDELMDERVQAWYVAMEEGLWWGWTSNSLSSTKLVGDHRAFASPRDWVAWTDVLLKLGMVVKAPGVSTQWAPGWGFRKAITWFQRREPWVPPSRPAPRIKAWSAQRPEHDSPLPRGDVVLEESA